MADGPSPRCWLLIVLLVAISCSDILGQWLTGTVYLLAHAAGYFSASGIWFSVTSDRPEPPEEDVSSTPAGAVLTAVFVFAVGVLAWGQPVVEAVANLCGLSDDFFAASSSEITSNDFTRYLINKFTRIMNNP